MAPADSEAYPHPGSPCSTRSHLRGRPLHDLTVISYPRRSSSETAPAVKERRLFEPPGLLMALLYPGPMSLSTRGKSRSQSKSALSSTTLDLAPGWLSERLPISILTPISKFRARFPTVLSRRPVPAPPA